jgi:cytochrome P450
MLSETGPLIEALFRRDAAMMADPYPAYDQLRDAGAVYWLPGPPQGPPWLNAWHLFSYNAVSAALRDGRFSSRRPMLTMPLEHFGIDGSTPEAQFFTTMQSGMMLTMDAPDHTRLRRLALKAFTPRVVGQMRGEVRSIVDQLLDDVGSSFDVMQAVAAPLPAMVIARLLGIPEADWAQFKTWSDGLIGFNITREKVSNFARLGDYLREQIAQRRVEPRDDLISHLVVARDENDALTEDELIGQCIILLVGGHETSTYALGNAVLRLLEAPEYWHELPAVPIDLAVNELLRFDSPFQALSRRTIEDVEMDGHQLAAGSTVWLWIAAANRDPRRFANPNALDFARADNRHLSFGLGPHYCLGAALAQLEIGVALEAMRQRWPALHLEPGGLTWKADGAIRGPSSLAVAA